MSSEKDNDQRDSHSSRESRRSRCSYNFYSDDKQEILNQLSEGVRIELEDTHWQIASYSPLQFVIANKDLKRIVHAYVNKREIESSDRGETITKVLTLHKVTLDAIPTIVIREISPPGFQSISHRYTITFETNGYNKRPFTITCKTLEEIFAQQKQMSLVPESRGGFDDLCKIVASFDKTESTTVREDIETPGFYMIEKRIKSYHLTDGESGSLPKQPSTLEINKCIDVIEKLVTKYKRRGVLPRRSHLH
jgi:hypothetical protein